MSSSKPFVFPKMPVAASSVQKTPKLPSFSLPKIKVAAAKPAKPFNFSKFTKVKTPKAAKLAVLKKAVKKSKNVGY